MRWLLLVLLLTGICQAKPERRLVHLRKTPLGYLAEVTPRYDYTTYLSRGYRVSGVEDAVLSAVSSAEGLPVRLYGEFAGDRVQVQRVAVGMPPPVLPVPAGAEVWRGRVRAVPVGPEKVRLDTGPGETVEATLAFENPGEREQWQAYAARPEFALLGTFVGGGSPREGDPSSPKAGGRLVDLTFAPWEPARQNGTYRVLLQLSEAFLNRVAQEYLVGHTSLFGWKDKNGVTGFQVRELGGTMLDCPQGELRLYGRLDGRVLGMSLVEGEWEARARPLIVGTRLTTPLAANSIQLRVTRPFFMSVPGLWTEGLRVMLGMALKDGLTLDLYRKELGLILEDGQQERFGLWTVPTGDRRTNLLVAAAPVDAGKPALGGPPETGTTDLLVSRLARGSHYAVSLAPAAVNAALARMIPPMLPLRRAIPPELQVNSQVFLFKLKLKEAEIPELDLGFANGRFVVRSALVVVHWALGPLSGVEPAARLAGTAAVTGEGSPLKLRVDPEITSLEVLSPHIKEQSPEEQAALREQLVRAVRGTTLDLPLPVTLAVPELSPKTALELVGVGSVGEDLVLQGRVTSGP